MAEIEEMINQAEHLLDTGNDQELRLFLEELNISEAKEVMDELPELGVKLFQLMDISRSVHVFRILDFPVQERILKKLSGEKIKELINELPPDDRTSFFSELPGDIVKKMIILLPAEDRKETLGLLGYEEDSIGRLMTPDYITVKQDWNVARVLDHIRKYGTNSETIDVVYVIDDKGVLLDDIRIRKIIVAEPDTLVKDLTDDRLISLKANLHQEEAIQIFKMNNRVALPVTDDAGVLLGIVTIDDILWVADEEFSEDMQKMGGVEALDEPYLDTPFFSLIKKRAGWLIILFISEMLTTSAMTYFQGELEKAMILAMFVPLVMSSGGNSGSQASTLIIQAMATGDVNLKDWWRVMKREVLSGLTLGVILGFIGFVRILVWHFLMVNGVFKDIYGVHWILIGLTVGVSLIGIILWGTLSGSMLPMILKRLGADPATSSAPFVATLVDVTGIVIYFSAAYMILKGILL